MDIAKFPAVQLKKVFFPESVTYQMNKIKRSSTHKTPKYSLSATVLMLNCVAALQLKSCFIRIRNTDPASKIHNQNLAPYLHSTQQIISLKVPLLVMFSAPRLPCQKHAG